MPLPLDRGLDVAILHIASQLFPCGYDVSPDAPDTYEKLQKHVADTGRMLVYSGHSDQTIFDDAEVNWAFRAWHDWHHLKGNHPFTLDGEKAVAEDQCLMLSALFPGHHNIDKWCALIRAEVVSQAEHFEETGSFVEDQRAFTLAVLQSEGFYL